MGVINDNNDDANAKDDYDDEGVGAAGGHGGGGGAGGVQGELRLGRQLDDATCLERTRRTMWAGSCLRSLSTGTARGVF